MTAKKTNLPASIMESIRKRNFRDEDVVNAAARGETQAIVASYNVHKCVGVDGKFDPERIAQVIAEIDADIIAIQEADKRFGEREGLLNLARLELETGLVPVRAGLREQSHGWHGNLLLFKKGVVGGVHKVKLPGLEPRGAVMVDLDLEGGAAIRIIAAHFGLLKHSRGQQTRMVLDLIGRREERPTVLMGDFNEWRVGNRSSLNTLRSVFGPLPPAIPTFPATLPVLALDRIMASRPGMVAALQAHDTPLARQASDHLPLKALINIPET
ncbi:endonuclease/exonuclease/phosphatase family protein [Corticibacterium sp. UT-5YL-CI-8]|nr:endonuclease/exonuclease/phosphatase family protein [Tianweitania sp. UT-5YL-CI-8]